MTDIQLQFECAPSGLYSSAPVAHLGSIIFTRAPRAQVGSFRDRRRLRRARRTRFHGGRLAHAWDAGVSFPRPFGLRAYVVARRAGRRPSSQLLLQPVAICRCVGGGAVVVRA